MKSWISMAEVMKFSEGAAKSERLFDLYSIASFCKSGFYSSDYKVDNWWADNIKLTPYGTQLLDHAKQQGIKASDSEANFILFNLFSYHELFIDYLKSDIQAIRSKLDDMRTNGHLRWPYIWGNRLYHKYNDGPLATRTSHMDAPDAERLIQETPAGVFQLGALVSGPFGFIQSSERRFYPPTLSFALWHCSDLGCMTSHNVELQQHDSSVNRLSRDLKTHFLESYGPPSEWSKGLSLSLLNSMWPSNREYQDMLPLIGDCVLGVERTQLLARCLRSPNNKILLDILDANSKLHKSPDKTASSLTAEEQHQLLLLLKDTSLVSFIDELVYEKKINVPAAERRSAKRSILTGRRRKSVLSSLGLQSNQHDAMVELASSIWFAYEQQDLVSELLWKLRDYKLKSVRTAVVEYIKQYGADQALRYLIFSSEVLTKVVMKSYNLSAFSGESEKDCINRLLWKMGFNIFVYDDKFSILEQRIREFKEALQTHNEELNESEKAKIRGIGVNLFVSVEEFLEDFVCYNVWVMASDHFAETNFFYMKDRALKTVKQALGDQIKSGSEKIRWSDEGINSLGPLIAYAQAFRGWLRRCARRKRSILARDKNDYPHFSNDSTVLFPFKHKELWADLEAHILEEYTKIIENICILISKADLPSVRNGIDHKRKIDKFPSRKSMLNCISCIEQVVNEAVLMRLFPKLYWLKSHMQDSSGTEHFEFIDYKSTITRLNGPSFVAPMTSITFESAPYLIAPLDLLGQPNSPLIFRVAEQSEYYLFWKNYPRRRFIPPRAE